MSWRKLSRIAALTSSTVGAYAVYSRVSTEADNIRIQMQKQRMQNIWTDIYEKNPEKYNKNAIMFAIKDRKYSFWERMLEEETHSYIDMNMAMMVVQTLRTATINLEQESNSKHDIVIFIDTCGGEVGSVKMICDAIKTFKKKFSGKCIVIIQEKAFSGGTIIALSADEIMMNDYSLISKIDPQLMGIAIKHFDLDDTDKGLINNILSGLARDGYGTMDAIINDHIKPQHDPDAFKNIINELLLSDSLHGHTYNKEACEKMGLKVTLIPPELDSKLGNLTQTNIK
jgi:ATP-dependent protease ClpP protease subunit